MKNHLTKMLSELGLRLNDGVLDRLSSLTEVFRSDQIPEPIRLKSSGFLDRSAERSFLPHPKLDLFLNARACHHAGNRRLHDQANVELVNYAVFYFLEELDHQPDHGPEGLADDWTVIARISIPVKRELDDYRLWSRRKFIREEWLGEQRRLLRQSLCGNRA